MNKKGHKLKCKIVFRNEYFLKIYCAAFAQFFFLSIKVATFSNLFLKMSISGFYFSKKLPSFGSALSQYPPSTSARSINFSFRHSLVFLPKEPRFDMKRNWWKLHLLLLTLNNSTKVETGTE